MIEVERVDIDISKLEAFARKMDGNVDQAIRTVAFQTEGYAKEAAPVKSGALKSSLNTQRVGNAEYIVADGVEYGIYQELGTSKMAAHPFLIPGLKRAVRDLYNVVKKELGL